MSKTLALYFTQDQVVEIGIDDGFIKMYQAQKAIGKRIIDAEDPEEEMAKIEAEAESAIAELQSLRNSLNNIALIMRDNCRNRITIDELEALEHTTISEEIIEAKDVPDEIRRLADE